MSDSIYEINSPDKLWHAEISACRGANISCLQYKGKHILMPFVSHEKLNENPFVQGSPLLLPAGRTAGGVFTFGGREYHLEITDTKNNLNLHGLLYKQEFSVVKAERERIVLWYENIGRIYPFNFCITAEYLMANSGFKQIFTIKNCGKTDMPYTFALHTCFFEPEYFSVPVECAQEKDERHIPTGKYIPLSCEEERYVSGTNPHGLHISGYYRANGNTAVIGDYIYTMSDAFDHYVLYNAGGNSGYLCVEPQAGAVNGLNIPGGCHIIPVGENHIFSTSISKRI